MKNQEVLIYLDCPKEIPSKNPFFLQGWIISHVEIHEIWLINASKKIALEFMERPDVIKVHPSYPYVKGFKGTVDVSVMPENAIKLGYRLESGEFSHTILLNNPAPKIAEKAWKTDTFIYLEQPLNLPTEKQFIIQGWIVSYADIRKVWLPNAPKTPLKLVTRPDVLENIYHNYAYAKGFIGEVDHSLLEGNTITLHYQLEEGKFTYPIILSNLYPLTDMQKAEKFNRIIPHLICPNCKTVFTEQQLRKECFSCVNCGNIFENNGQNFNFLTEELKKQFKVVDTSNVSANQYNSIITYYIRQYADGLILDCGAGKKHSDYPNVINFEIVPYSSTDILGVGEILPFQDNTFDAVFSFAVLEHVSDPFRCAKEIARVLKTGGILLCVVPFLQPVHGYPNHFYNMTSQGLQNLFDKYLDIIDVDVPQTGVPVWTLSWFLRSWAAGLNNKTRQDFLNMRVSDLIGEPIDYLAQDFVQNLSKDKIFELACTTAILAKKP